MQPNDVLAYVVNHSGDEAVRPVDMPTVRVPEGEWGKGDWVARKIEPDVPVGRVEAVQVDIQKPGK
nr:hypothetical protein [Microbispora rosea]